MTPDQIRAAADEYADPYADDVNAPDLSQLPAIFGLVIEDKLEDSYDVSELVHNLNQNVQVRQGKWPASSGEWNVRVNGMFTLRNK